MNASYRFRSRVLYQLSYRQHVWGHLTLSHLVVTKTYCLFRKLIQYQAIKLW